MRILVVEDEAQIRTALSVNMRARGYHVDLATTGEQALHLAASTRPDLVLLDLGLPGISGLDVIRGLRGWTTVPIVVLTVRDSESDKVGALDLGADDYLTKPFGMDELLARIRAVLRRKTTEPDEPIVRTSAFTIDLTTTTIVDGSNNAIHLTPIEWKLVELLVRHPGRLLTQTALVEAIWGDDLESGPSYLRVHMAAIRKKLEPNPSQPTFFLTETGMGYRFVVEPT